MLYFDKLFIEFCSNLGKLFLSDLAGLNSTSYGFFIFVLLVAMVVGFLGGGKNVH